MKGFDRLNSGLRETPWLYYVHSFPSLSLFPSLFPSLRSVVPTLACITPPSWPSPAQCCAYGGYPFEVVCYITVTYFDGEKDTSLHSGPWNIHVQQQAVDTVRSPRDHQPGLDGRCLAALTPHFRSPGLRISRTLNTAQLLRPSSKSARSPTPPLARPRSGRIRPLFRESNRKDESLWLSDKEDLNCRLSNVATFRGLDDDDASRPRVVHPLDGLVCLSGRIINIDTGRPQEFSLQPLPASLQRAAPSSIDHAGRNQGHEQEATRPPSSDSLSPSTTPPWGSSTRTIRTTKARVEQGTPLGQQGTCKTWMGSQHAISDTRAKCKTAGKTHRVITSVFNTANDKGLEPMRKKTATHDDRPKSFTTIYHPLPENRTAAGIFLQLFRHLSCR
ncbi:hypothetical protein K456DRAFT_357941 [Colletotrichum gloeosporioides 23]|nr:hypothetical protein K456DRAFT_357941 [Colletotrichum gloeosporioides 23]